MSIVVTTNQRNVMKPSRLFWGVLFVALGTFFLLGEDFWIDVGWSTVWKFWPLLLVLVGLAMMIKQNLVRNVLAAVAGIGLAWFVYALASFAWLDAIRVDDWESDGGDVLVQEFTEPMPAGFARATLNFDAAAGKFTVDTVLGYTLAAKLRTNIGRYAFDHQLTDSAIRLSLKLEGSVHLKSWRGEKSLNVGEIRLSPVPLWDMNFDVGAANVEFDLRPFRVENVSIDAGAANVCLYLGIPERDMRCRIETGVSTLKVFVPDSVGCEIRLESGLSSKRFVGFEKASDRIYRTDNFAEATKRIFIDAKAGLSTLRVERY